MKPQKFFDVRQQGREADIYIFGDIVTDRWSPEETSAYSLKEAVKNLDVDVINVYIDSYGGSVSEGWAIYNELRRHSAYVRTYGTGFIASAALYPFMAGDERYAMTPCAFFFHQMSEGVWGNPDSLRKAAEELEKLNEIGRAAFTENTQLSAEDVKAMEREETWLSPQEALELGIATAMLTSKPDVAAAQSAKSAIIQRVLAGPAPAVSHEGETLPPEEKARDEPENTPEQKEKTGQPESVMGMLARMANNRKDEEK